MSLIAVICIQINSRFFKCVQSEHFWHCSKIPSLNSKDAKALIHCSEVKTVARWLVCNSTGLNSRTFSRLATCQNFFISQFSNLLGTVYRRGNVDFMPDGFTLASPVGNKVTFYDLRNHKSETLPVETRLNVVHVALAPSGTHVMLVTESGEGLYISLSSRTVLYRHNFGKPLSAVRFSPCGRHLAAARDTDVHVYRVPATVALRFNPFYMEHIYHVGTDVVTCVQWSEDSSLLLVGSMDTQTRVVGGDKLYSNLYVSGMVGHAAPIVSAFFQVVSVDRSGTVILWTCSVDYGSLVPQSEDVKDDQKVDRLVYKKSQKHRVHDSVPGGSFSVTCASYNPTKQLLALGYSNGVFTLHELPDFQLVQSFTLSAGENQVGSVPIRSLALNSTADWLAVAASAGGARTQLVVWEWQSESFVMKQQGHSHTLTSLAYSPDGCRLATGSEDGRVKIWQQASGLCDVTFDNHDGAVTDIKWTQGGKAVLSAALDGTVKACDLKRYRNFRTLATPRPAQLSCLAVDSSGELVAAGCSDLFDVFLWSLNNGRLLEVFSGHESPVSSVSFPPLAACGTLLASCSWDGFARLWHVGQGHAGNEPIRLGKDALCVTFSPDGGRLAVLTIDSLITMFDWRNSLQVGTIECRLDLDPGRAHTDIVKAKTSGAAKHFTSIAYSPDGEYILAGGQSNHICLYHAQHCVLVRKFTVTQNFSLDGVADGHIFSDTTLGSPNDNSLSYTPEYSPLKIQPELNRNRMNEFGVTAAQIAGAQNGEDDSESWMLDDKGKLKRRLNLPGAKVGDFSERVARPEIVVKGVAFCPTGQSFAAVTSEGLLVYGTQKQLLFEPFDLNVTVTPRSVMDAIERREFGQAITDALRLNDKELIGGAVHSVPSEQIPLHAANLDIRFAIRLLRWLAANFASTPHIEFDSVWLRCVLRAHGTSLKSTHSSQLMPELAAAHEAVAAKCQVLGKLCESNQFTLDYLLATCQAQRSQRLSDAKMETE